MGTEKGADAVARFNVTEMKSGGIIKQKQRDAFTVRLRLPGGRVGAEKLPVIARVADEYGQGYVHLSVRQTVEIPYVLYDRLEDCLAELAKAGLSPSSCGPRVRVPIACSGCELNPNGNIETQRMAQEIDRRWFGTPTPHKFKINISGCPIDCMAARRADLGIIGITEPKLDAGLCTGCELCVAKCGDDALTMTEDLPLRDVFKCIGCGDCIHVCPLDALGAGRTGMEVWAGGKWGKRPRAAQRVARWVAEEQLDGVIERTLAWYREHAQGRERLGAIFDREGIAGYQEQVFGSLSADGVELEMPPAGAPVAWKVPPAAPDGASLDLQGGGTMEGRGA